MTLKWYTRHAQRALRVSGISPISQEIPDALRAGDDVEAGPKRAPCKSMPHRKMQEPRRELMEMTERFTVLIKIFVT
jgi:hypothetical protein